MNYQSPHKPAAGRKAIKEGSGVAATGIILAVLFRLFRGKNPDVIWDPAQDPEIVAATSGGLFALFRWLRKRFKRWRDNRGNN